LSQYSTSRRASPRGLGYLCSTTWKRQDSGASQDTFYKMTLQFEKSTRLKARGLRATCPSVFSPDCLGYSCQNIRLTLRQNLQLNLRLRGYSIWSAILQSHFHISFGFKTIRAFLETFTGSTRGRLGLLEKTSGLLKHQLEYIPASGCFDYS
jgi:hypothetical protein